MQQPSYLSEYETGTFSLGYVNATLLKTREDTDSMMLGICIYRTVDLLLMKVPALQTQQRKRVSTGWARKSLWDAEKKIRFERYRRLRS